MKRVGFLLIFLIGFVLFVWFSEGKSALKKYSEGKNELRLQTTSRVIDVNANGIIDVNEFSTVQQRLLLYDKNKDGRLSRTELGGSSASKDEIRKSAIVRAIDLNSDARFSELELENAAQNILKLDINKDGKLDKEEMN